MNDHDFIVQGSYGDGTVCYTDGSDDRKKAVSMAEGVLRSPLFEGESVRVISRDGELVWTSQEEV